MHRAIVAAVFLLVICSSGGVPAWGLPAEAGVVDTSSTDTKPQGTSSETGAVASSSDASPADTKDNTASGSGSADSSVEGGDETVSVVVETEDVPERTLTDTGIQALLAEPWPGKVPMEAAHHPRCKGKAPSDSFKIDKSMLAKRRICLVVVSYKTPKSLENSVRSWDRAGLFDFVDDKIMWLNAPQQVERDLGEEFGFRVFEPKKVLHHVFKTDFPQMFKGKHPQRYPAVVQHSEQNAWTVAPSFVHAADLTDADYVLFLEKDFEIPDHYDREHVRTELLNALMYMERGVKLFRLRSRQDMGGDGFPNCCSKRCRQVWSGGNTWTRQRNWFSYWCEKLPSRAKAKKLVAQCDDTLRTRCYTSQDTNWSNNPFLINREYIFHGEKSGNIAKVALWGSSQKKNGKFEVNMLNGDWGKHKAPVCQSYEGIFHHHEIDGRRLLRGDSF